MSPQGKRIAVLVEDLYQDQEVWYPSYRLKEAGVEVVTVTAGVPAEAMSVAGIAAVSWVAETRVVVRADPAKLTTEVETKPVPLTVKVNPGSPAVFVSGERVVMAGTGLLTVSV